MTPNRPLIMVTNDDGIDAPGIRHLIDCVTDFADVITVAPAGPRSGQAAAITVDQPLRIISRADYHGAKMNAVTGTPADCVKLGLHTVMPRKPDLLLSGVNHGANSGNSVIYSGTMGAVIEGCMAGITSVGFSLLQYGMDADFSHTTPFIIAVTKQVLAGGLPEGVCLNVNIPAHCTPEGIKVTEAAPGYWTEEYKEYADPSGRPFYMLTGRFVNSEPENPATDLYWLERNFVTVTPVRPDLTDRRAIEDIDRLLADA